MHIPEESDSGAVPMSHSNNDGQLSAESGEGRLLIKENVCQPNKQRGKLALDRRLVTTRKNYFAEGEPLSSLFARL
jgi:hypothetical protein